MRFSFTPASQRALAIAADWSVRADYAEIAPETLLAGLLAQPECRAAVMLAGQSIDMDALCKQWPTLGVILSNNPNPLCNGENFSQEISPSEGGPRQLPLSANIDDSLQAASECLDFLPRPLELATEHLLLGLAAADHEVSGWLRRQGLKPDAIEAEIRRLHGYVWEGTGGEGPGTGEENPNLFPRSAWERTAPVFDVAALRILDASANRAREGLRVIEDYVRFALDDQHLTSLCKQMRHDLTEALAWIPTDIRLAARETQGDVGTVLTTGAERRRGDLACVVRANFARLQESLRSLEEFGKLDVLVHSDEFLLRKEPSTHCHSERSEESPRFPRFFAALRMTNCLSATETTDADSGFSSAIKQLRYRVYTLERAVEITRRSLERLASARLYVLIDGRSSAEEFERLAGSLIDAGVHVIQLRDKRLGDRELLDRARHLRKLTRDTKTLFILNDRPDLAALSGADGVHLGQEEISVKDARRIVGPDALVGVSTHSIEQARQAVLDGANYIGVGPTFPSDTKQFERFPGVELLRDVAADLRLPAFAIGGIHRENLAEVTAAGISRVAVSGAIASADDPGGAARELLAMLGE